MSELPFTCRTPVGWTIGQAAAALVAYARETGCEQSTIFNGVRLVAWPGTEAGALASRYWRAFTAGLPSTSEVNLLCEPDAAQAAAADAEGQRTRSEICGSYRPLRGAR